MLTDSDGKVDFLEIKASLNNDAVKKAWFKLMMMQRKVHKIKANVWN